MKKVDLIYLTSRISISWISYSRETKLKFHGKSNKAQNIIKKRSGSWKGNIISFTFFQSRNILKISIWFFFHEWKMKSVTLWDQIWAELCELFVMGGWRSPPFEKKRKNLFIFLRSSPRQHFSFYAIYEVCEREREGENQLKFIDTNIFILCLFISFTFLIAGIILFTVQCRRALNGWAFAFRSRWAYGSHGTITVRFFHGRQINRIRIFFIFFVPWLFFFRGCYDFNGAGLILH